MAMKTKANNIQFDYDEQADVLHISFGTGEPSFSEEFDDLLVIEFGMYSRTPTGFQLLHVREVGIDKVEVQLKRAFKKVQSQEDKVLAELTQQRQRLFRKAIEKVEEEAKDLVEA